MSNREKVKIGDEISFKNGAEGIVEKINENSVIVRITSNSSGQEFFGNKTVVAHKNYKILSK